jgi:Flp pilus assembly protein TadG
VTLSPIDQPAQSAIPSTTRTSRRRTGLRWHGAKNRCRGVAATEFAIVAPVFFLLMIGMIEFSRAMMVQQVLVNASRVGAREAVTVDSTLAGVVATVEDYANGVAVPGVTVGVTPDPSTADAGDVITVTTSVPYNNVSWLPAPWFLSGKTLTASSVMRKEGFN